MEMELPKRMYKQGEEPEVNRVNNCCRTSILGEIQKQFPVEYDEVKADPVFAHIMAIQENNLAYSGLLVHSLLMRQLETAKVHELWFVFANKPTRFSLQEFHAVTGLNCKEDESCDLDLDEWVDDKGFWSRFLSSSVAPKITLVEIRHKYINAAKKWSRPDRRRLVYLCVIAGVLLVKDEKMAIPINYVKLLMDIDKLRAYPWGVKSFDHLLQSFKDARERMKPPRTYNLHGFSYAFQIWIMEAIPDFGQMLGEKVIDEGIVFPRCSNWRGSGILTYAEINSVEKSFGSQDVVHPFISSTDNGVVIKSEEFIRADDEINDETVDHILAYIEAGKDWRKHIWLCKPPVKTALPMNLEQKPQSVDEVQDEISNVASPNRESSYASTSRKRKNNFVNRGAAERKRNLLYQKEEAKKNEDKEEMKCFITGLFQTLEKKLESNTKTDREAEIGIMTSNIVGVLKDLISESRVPKSGETSNMNTRASPANVDRQSQPQHEKVIRNDAASFDDVAMSLDDDGSLHDVGVSQVPNIKLEKQTEELIRKENLHEVGVSEVHNMKLEMQTQEMILKAKQHISKPESSAGQRKSKPKATKAAEWLTPSTTFMAVYKKDSDSKVLGKHKNIKKEFTLTDDCFEAGRNAPESPLIFFEEEDWNDFSQWSLITDRKPMDIGPTNFTYTVANRFMVPSQWLVTEDIDAAMYLLREKTSLRRWNVERVGFMCCLFSVHMKSEYYEYLKKKKEYRFPKTLLSYAKGELPAHGKTGMMWDADVDRIYVPVNIGNSHWISLCISFRNQTVEVFDCNVGVRTNAREVEPFAFMIPRIVKEVLPPALSKDLKLSKYVVTYQEKRNFLNTSQCHCGPYAVKYIECHALGLDITLLDDESILCARQKIAVDLFKAAKDPEFVARIKLYEPPATVTNPNVVSV